MTVPIAAVIAGIFLMYYEADLKEKDEMILCQVDLLYFAGIRESDIRDMEDGG